MSTDLITGLLAGWLLGAATLVGLLALMVRTDRRLDCDQS